MNIAERYLQEYGTDLSKEIEQRSGVTVMKFGGTAMQSPESIKQIADIIYKHSSNGEQLIVVVSAVKGVTDLLDDLYTSLSSGRNDTGGEVLRGIYVTHMDIISRLAISPDRITTVSGSFIQYFEMLNRFVHRTREWTVQERDRILAHGEIFAARILEAQLSNGRTAARAIDSSDFLLTDESFGEARPMYYPSRNNLVKIVEPLFAENTTPLITGYFGVTTDGRITTMGKNTSDYTAALIGRMLDADEIWFWKDVNGLYTKPPAHPDAKFIEEASFQYAADMKSQVLCHKALESLLGTDITVRIKNFNNPDHCGTELTASSQLRIQ